MLQLVIHLPGQGADTALHSPTPPFPSQQVYYPPSPSPNPTTAPLTDPDARAAPQAVPDPSLASRRPLLPSGRPLHPARGPRTLLFTSMVPRQPLPAPCLWLRFMLRPGPAAVSGARGESAWPKGSGRGCGRGSPQRHLQRGGRGSSLRAELRWAAPHAARQGVGLAARPAGTRLPPSGPWRHRDGEGGAETTDSLAWRSATSPASSRARAHPSWREARRTRSPAASLKASEARAPPTPNRKRAPAPKKPTNRYTLCKARGRATF